LRRADDAAEHGGMTASPDRRAVLGASAALALGGCVSVDVNDAPPRAGPGRLTFRPPSPLAPIKAHADRIMDVTVCLRPFRAAGPRLDVETVGDKKVVHNYGHGGSGWSLSWGSGLVAVRNALQGGERDIAVIGCGALGMTAATLAQRAGARVTIYAKERMPDIRSARATGVWSPDSRIALGSAVDAGFAARWEEMARASFRIHRSYLGLADAPVEWMDNYELRDAPRGPRSGSSGPDFVSYGPRVRDLTPYEELAPDQHPFRVPYAGRSSTPVFNLAAYGHVLLNDFLLGGGRLETVEFHTPGELAALKQKVIINCTGYGARALWKDESIVPVRGQLAVLIPQPEVTYGVSYHHVGTVSRRDGLIVQGYGPDESYGYNDANETPDREDAVRSVTTIAELFKGVPGA
jgi:glycine/D-amino acid oxidase-like deaminating enzyme